MLYIVPTPIGNLEDITLRALRILREADVVACEDTRTSGVLLQHYQIETSRTSFHAFNEAAKADHLIARIQRGE
ncbi:MAG TPA: SAM-dependent methyltransferase, partial [Rhodothermales bacterium]|nr:SAM-dependent methyltransferase [Rhodothermales bacterium]